MKKTAVAGNLAYGDQAFAWRWLMPVRMRLTCICSGISFAGVPDGERIMPDENQVYKALQSVLHPKLQKNLVDIGMIRDINPSGEMWSA